MPSNCNEIFLMENAKHLNLSTGSMEALLNCPQGKVELGHPGDGKPLLKINNKSVYPENDPLPTVAKQAVDLMKGNKPDLLVFFGFGLGLHLEFIRRMSTVPIVVFDPDIKALSVVLASRPFKIDGVRLVIDHLLIADTMRLFIGRSTCRIQAGALPSWPSEYPNEFQQFKESINQVMFQMSVDRTTRSDYESIWISHTASNLSFLSWRKNWDVLGRSFAGKPAVVVGAGPSLDKNIDALAAAAEKFLIVATHSAVKPLAQKGIVPDLVAIIESNKLDEYFADVPNLDKMVLLASSQTHPAHLKLDFGSILGISQRGNVAASWLEKAYGEKPLPSGGSVACAAFSILHGLGCDPLIFVGMDLAFSEDRSHANGSCEGCCIIEFDHDKGTFKKHCSKGIHQPVEIPFEMVSAWGGTGKIAAHPVYSQFRKWFEAVARSWAGDRRLINATEGGSRIDGFEEIKLADVVKELGPESLSQKTEILASIKRAPAKNQALLAREVKAELALVQKAMAMAQESGSLADKALHLIRNSQFGQVQSVLDRLKEFEHRVQQYAHNTQLLNSQVGLSIQQIAAEKISGDDVARTIHSLEQSRKISAMIINGGRELLELFQQALKEMEEEE